MPKNNKKPGSKGIMDVIKDMPYFSIDNLSSLGVKDYYLKIILSRLKKKGGIISLKRGLYVSSSYLEKTKGRGNYNRYVEFISSVLYNPSYLSLEYVLNENNILTESSFGFSAVSTKKTNHFKNKLGDFYYSNVKEDLFCGFKTERSGDYFIYKATVGKALFDFLYLRKNMVTGKDFLESLRINKDQLKKSDLEEFKKYVAKEKSKKMKLISKYYAG